MDDFRSSLDSSESQIRLLRILPRYQQAITIYSLSSWLGWIKHYLLSSISTHPISCTLETTSSTENPNYFALSYVWGDPTLSKRILVNGTKVSITENLYIALRHLQHETNVVTIWIDAFCINEGDDERAEQVMKMKAIFQEAQHVLVWLGLAGDCSDELIDCLERIGRVCEDLEITGITSKMLVELSQTPDEPHSRDVAAKLEQLYEKFDYLFPDLFPFEAYRAFLRRGWWHHVSVIQELVLAREASFLCGKKTILYKHLNNAHTFLRGYCGSAMGRAKCLDNTLDQEHTADFEAIMNLETRRSAMSTKLRLREDCS
jgi:hypothetical protein